MGHSGNAFPPAISHICSATGTRAPYGNLSYGRCGSRASNCHWFEYPDSGRNRAESSGHVSSGRHRETGHSQRQDLQTFLPQEAGGTVNLNIGNGGDGHCADQLARSASKRDIDSDRWKTFRLRFVRRPPALARVRTLTSFPSR